VDRDVVWILGRNVVAVLVIGLELGLFFAGVMSLAVFEIALWPTVLGAVGWNLIGVIRNQKTVQDTLRRPE
jgi:hypothetical protein